MCPGVGSSCSEERDCKKFPLFLEQEATFGRNGSSSTMSRSKMAVTVSNKISNLPRAPGQSVLLPSLAIGRKPKEYLKIFDTISEECVVLEKVGWSNSWWKVEGPEIEGDRCWVGSSTCDSSTGCGNQPSQEIGEDIGGGQRGEGGVSSILPEQVSGPWGAEECVQDSWKGNS